MVKVIRHSSYVIKNGENAGKERFFLVVSSVTDKRFANSHAKYGTMKLSLDVNPDEIATDFPNGTVIEGYSLVGEPNEAGFYDVKAD